MASVPGAVTYFTAAGAPNPAFVEMFASEKGINLLSIAHVIDLGGGTNYHRTVKAYAQKNPAGGTPYLEFEDGTVISETVAICELLDSASPSSLVLSCLAEVPLFDPSGQRMCRDRRLRQQRKAVRGEPHGEGPNQHVAAARRAAHRLADVQPLSLGPGQGLLRRESAARPIVPAAGARNPRSLAPAVYHIVSDCCPAKPTVGWSVFVCLCVAAGHARHAGKRTGFSTESAGRSQPDALA